MEKTEQVARPSPSPLPVREDCWSEDATFTLVEAWGDRHLDLNRGNLRQKHWQEVADAVNERHGALKKARRTDIQCKNRMDTLKKKYKAEKAKILESNGTLTSSWPFYYRLDALIGPSTTPSMKKPSPTLALPAPYPAPAPVHGGGGGRSERRQTNHTDEFRRSYSVAAAAAAAADSGSSRSSGESGPKEEVDGFRELAQAIVKFGEIYERVEGEKQKQMIELEKERMEFMKSLEYERMQLFMDTQLQLERIKRAKRSSATADSYL